MSSHSKSYPRVPSSQGQSLPYAKSEGATMLGKVASPKPPVPSSSTTKPLVTDYSSDESGGEDEHIVRIDSPSRLSFPHVQ